MNKKVLIWVLLTVMLPFACSRPVSDEFFEPTSDRDAYGRFCFNIDMADSTISYNISLMTFFGGMGRNSEPFITMPLDMMWESPEGMQYEENVVIDGRYLLYRENIRPIRAGIWHLYIKVPEDSLRKYKFDGMGVRVERVKSDNSN